MTEDQEAYIVSNWNDMTGESLRKSFNEKYGTQYKTTAFHYHTKRLGLSKHIEHQYTEEEDAFLRDNSNVMTRQELTDAFNRKYGTELKLNAIEMRCHLKGWKASWDGKFRKGGNPWDKTHGGRSEYIRKLKGGNKTSFKKGHISNNTRDIGYVSLWSHNVRIKTNHGWDNRLRWLWKKSYGEIPDGYIVTSVDGDPYTNDPENLRCITNNELTVLMSNNWVGKGKDIVDTGIVWNKLRNVLQDNGDRK